MNKKFFFKENQDDKIYWVGYTEEKGPMEFTFDKKKIYNLFTDYPDKLTKEEKEIFDRENKYWADFFKDRNEKRKTS